jgi:DNA-binding CsgD family transcriptional regulator
MQPPPIERPLIMQATGGPTLAVLAQMADALPWPMLVLHADGWLMYANRAARVLLNDGRTLSLDGRRLLLTPARLQDDLDTAGAAAAGSGARSLMTLPGPGTGYTATIARLGTSDSGTPTGEAAHVLLALAGDDSRIADTQCFAELHGLSKAETRVLLGLARGESSTLVAQALGVTASTVRSQILSLRRKTGHASVAHLLRALNRMPPVGPALEGLAENRR